jgi:hypothetical protein
MSDKPLFENTDEQEALYAPHQLPEGTSADHAADIDDGPRDTNTTGDDIGVPAAGAGLLGQTGGGVVTGGVVGGSPSATGPVTGGAAPEDETAGDRPV